MARSLTLAQARSLPVRQASAERFPQQAPYGRTRGLSNPVVSNPGLWRFALMPEVRAVMDRVAGQVERVSFRPCVNIEGAPVDKCPPLVDSEGEVAEGVSPRLAEACAEIWASVRSPSGDQADLFASVAASYTLAADAWQFGYPGDQEMRYDPNGTVMWVGLARDALTIQGEVYVVDVGIGGKVRVPMSGDAHGAAVRIWKQNPQAPAMADSWVTAAARSLEILSGIYEATAASALSRINAGIVLAPDDQDQIPVPSSAIINEGQKALGEDVNQVLYDEIADHVQESANELDGFARVVPPVIGMNSNLIEKVRWLEMARAMDPELGKRIDDLRYRVAECAPTPPEVILGLGQTNHWNAEAITEGEYQSSTLPVCAKICSANTSFVLREGLRELRFSEREIASVQIGCSASNLLTPADRTEPALKLAALDTPTPALSPSEIRDATGFGDMEGPDDDETYRSTVLWLAGKNPAYAPLLDSIGIAMPATADAAPVIEASSQIAMGVKEISRTAAAPPEDDVGAGLVGVATTYEQALGVLFGAVIDRMAERASSRLASLARSKPWADLRSAIQTAPEAMRGVVPGVTAKLRQEGVDDGDLFEPALTTFAPRFQTLTTQAQKAAVRKAGGRWEDFSDRAETANAAAWALAGTLLIGEARRRFEGRLPSDGAEGPVDPFAVPSGIVRRTSAVAGGDDDVAPGADPDRLSPVTLNTVATASIARLALAAAGRTIIGWTWDYRPEIARNTYEDHFDLHATFELGSQPGDFGGYYPGDHKGCECVLRPVTGLAQVGEGVTF